MDADMADNELLGNEVAFTWHYLRVTPPVIYNIKIYIYIELGSNKIKLKVVKMRSN
jgi:hypothetical protein